MANIQKPGGWQRFLHWGLENGANERGAMRKKSLRDVDVSLSYAREGEHYVLTTRVCPRWDALITHKLALTEAEKGQLNALYGVEAFRSFAFATDALSEYPRPEALAKQNISFTEAPQGTFTFQHTYREADGNYRGMVFKKYFEHLKETWPERAQDDFNSFRRSLFEKSVPFEDVQDFFVSGDNWLRSPLPENKYVFPGHSLLEKLAREPRELGAIDAWLKERGIRGVRFLGAGAHAIVLETDGNFVVRLQAKTEGHNVFHEPEIAEPVFSTSTAHAYVDIMQKHVDHVQGAPSAEEIEGLAESLRRRGFKLHDRHAGNFKRLRDGTLLVIDTGAVYAPANAEDSRQGPKADDRWLTKDGISRQHADCTWLVYTGEDKVPRFAAEAMCGGNYSVPALSVDAWMKARRDLLPDAHAFAAMKRTAIPEPVGGGWAQKVRVEEKRGVAAGVV